jgi:Tol biopolymer transport system component
MQLTTGTRLGPYEIVSRLGAGGMGEVWKARDTRLDRTVAIKVSNEQFSQRFEHEARAIAALNHPHICQLYDVGPNYLVMESIDGHPLKGPLPLDQALDFAGQICDALDAAHKKGIVHRDLKPANILATKAGVKLLDFGLAKLRPSAPLDDATATMPLTTDGQIVGTLQYMSPEQLQGNEADARSDIFSFGLVLYEMLTGKRAFDGANQASVIASILSAEPEPLPSDEPVMLKRVVTTRLAKDPDARFQTARDLKRALEWSRLREAAAPSPRRWWLLWAVAALLALAAGILAFLHFGQKPPEMRLVKFTIPSPEKFSVGLPILSPDGRRLAFVMRDQGGHTKLWVRPLDSLAAQSVAGTEGASTPFWSPDSRFLGYWAGSQLKRIDTGGGPAQLVCESSLANGGLGSAWTNDGFILFVRNLGAIYRVSASGGEPEPLTELEASRKESRHYFPSILPDGLHMLYTVTSPLPEVQGVWVASLKNPREKRRLIGDVSKAEYSQGHLLFVRSGNLMAQLFDADRLELRGEPAPIVDHVNYSATIGFAAFSVSRNGELAVGSLLLQRRLAWFDRGGKSFGAFGEPGLYQRVSLSPDQSRVAVDSSSATNPNYELFVLDPARGATTQLTFGAASGNFPVWSPDGKRIAFGSNRDGVYNIYEKPSSGAGREEVLFKNDQNKFLTDWSRDGRYLLYGESDPKTNKQGIWVLPMTGERKPALYLGSEFFQWDGHFSPDGRSIAYSSDESSRMEVYVQSFPAGSGKLHVSTGGGNRPRWRNDGKELYYMDPSGKLMAVEVKQGASIEVGVPKLLFETGLDHVLQGYDVARSGDRFVMPVPAEGVSAEPIRVILNWTLGLKK